VRSEEAHGALLLSGPAAGAQRSARRRTAAARVCGRCAVKKCTAHCCCQGPAAGAHAAAHCCCQGLQQVRNEEVHGALLQSGPAADAQRSARRRTAAVRACGRCAAKKCTAHCCCQGLLQVRSEARGGALLLSGPAAGAQRRSARRTAAVSACGRCAAKRAAAHCCCCQGQRQVCSEEVHGALLLSGPAAGAQRSVRRRTAAVRACGRCAAKKPSARSTAAVRACGRCAVKCAAAHCSGPAAGAQRRSGALLLSGPAAGAQRSARRRTAAVRACSRCAAKHAAHCCCCCQALRQVRSKACGGALLLSGPAAGVQRSARRRTASGPAAGAQRSAQPCTAAVRACGRCTAKHTAVHCCCQGLRQVCHKVRGGALLLSGPAAGVQRSARRRTAAVRARGRCAAKKRTAHCCCQGLWQVRSEARGGALLLPGSAAGAQ
jgi:hypothetical protein